MLSFKLWSQLCLNSTFGHFGNTNHRVTFLLNSSFSWGFCHLQLVKIPTKYIVLSQISLEIAAENKNESVALWRCSSGMSKACIKLLSNLPFHLKVNQNLVSFLVISVFFKLKDMYFRKKEKIETYISLHKISQNICSS